MKKLLLIGLVVIAACSGEQAEEDCTTDACLKQQAYNKVMIVHDEVMPKLSTIAELKGKLEERLTHSIDSATANNYIRVLQDLEVADKGMWAWMRAFNSASKEWPLDSALNYLKSEQAKVDVVAENINSSIAAAEEALN